MSAHTPEFDAAFASWFAEASRILADHYALDYPKNVPDTLAFECGRRYVRVLRVASHGGRSAHAFVDTTSGDVLKPDGWKGPAKGARGNIYKPGQLGVGAYGAHTWAR